MRSTPDAAAVFLSVVFSSALLQASNSMPDDTEPMMIAFIDSLLFFAAYFINYFSSTGQ